MLKDHGINISMDSRGWAMDNIMVERLWRSVKYEEIYFKAYSSVAELIEGLRLGSRNLGLQRIFSFPALGPIKISGIFSPYRQKWEEFD